MIFGEKHKRSGSCSGADNIFFRKQIRTLPLMLKTGRLNRSFACRIASVNA